MSESKTRKSAPVSTPMNTPPAPRRGNGRWLPGSSPNPAGRPPKPREVEIHEASARGCSLEEWAAVVAKLVKLALEGDVPAARLLAQVRGALVEAPPQAVEVGESLAAVLERPGAADRIANLMDEIFETTPATPTA